MRRIGKQLIRERKEAILHGSATKPGIEKQDVQSRDLLSLLVKANLATDVPESQRLSEDEVLSRAYSSTASSAAPLTSAFQRSPGARTPHISQVSPV